MSGPGSGVSKARLVITAVVVEGGSQSEVAREYGGLTNGRSGIR